MTKRMKKRAKARRFHVWAKRARDRSGRVR